MSAANLGGLSLRTGIRSASRRPCLPAEALIALVCLWLVLCCNAPFWSALAQTGAPFELRLALGIALFALHGVLLGLFAWGRGLQPLLALLLVMTAAVNWYMERYAAVFDVDMIRNVLQTDPTEAREMLDPGLLLHVALFGLLPATALLMLHLPRLPWQRELRNRALFLVGMGLLAAVVLGPFLQGTFTLMRSDPMLRYRITPGNYLISLGRALVQEEGVPSGPKQGVAADAHRITPPAGRRPRAIVLVIGETVRGDHWGLNGYARQTTPLLAARSDIVNFADVTACGTSTAVSLPCMFSPFGRAHYDRKAILAHETLLDVLARTGIEVLWRDNQAGCKGVCDRVENQSMAAQTEPDLCRAGRCFDEILLRGLAERIDASSGDLLVVLHPVGSHGPNYFERYPPEHERFQPACHSSVPSRCSREEVVNAYDNSILYADVLLERLIELLATRSSHDTAMLYLSDHGESLGEYGLYLHGAPYAVAPRVQTHVPMLLWMASGFANHLGIDTACLQAGTAHPRSHDDLFHSLLGMFDVASADYRATHDILRACRTNPPSASE
ncbi:phosphoethanolamine--lipid A transferase [Xanthomonadaceae bacterium JHOS43]|nr:phosphoethanolamine--lipid A transferase [Xanthomonadaceae bacterium JHOS43]